MSEERRIVLGSLGLAALVAVVLGAQASPDHAIARGSGGAALTLLLLSLSTSPLARIVSARWAVALRSGRRRVGIASAVAASGHALVALSSYVVPLTLHPIVVLPWLRHGAIALGILVALLVTSFPALQRVLRVRAWSALHRLVYAAAILASLHALAVPFGTARVGLVALGLTLVLLTARPLTSLLARRRTPDPD